MKLKICLSAILLAIVSLSVFSSEPFEYQIVGAGSGTQGNYLVKVFVISKKNKPDVDLLKKCAVHGVLFKGFSDQQSRMSQKPLAGSALSEQEHSDFFVPFFQDGGAYSNYVDLVVAQYDIVKMAKKEYRIGATFSVAKEQLRKDLEKAGVIKGLASGF
ncbi:MAG TPA: hypothetical protein K8W07_04125 [Bacteroides togonis]|nr:hypothetical protein [Bacteroides togonis]